MLDALLGSKLRARVLGWLFTHPDERYFVRQLTGLLVEDSTNVSRELARLENLGVLVSTREGKQKYYQVNQRSPIYDELHGLVIKTVGVADVVRSALAPLAEQIKVAFIFGSFAAGTETRTSDIDVMIIGKATFDEVVSAIGPAEEKIDREINCVVYPAGEFRQKARTSEHFVDTVLESEKIFLIGDERELAPLAR